MKTMYNIGVMLVILGIVTICVGTILEGHAWQLLGAIVMVSYVEIICSNSKEKAESC